MSSLSLINSLLPQNGNKLRMHMVIYMHIRGSIIMKGWSLKGSIGALTSSGISMKGLLGRCMAYLGLMASASGILVASKKYGRDGIKIMSATATIWP